VGLPLLQSTEEGCPGTQHHWTIAEKEAQVRDGNCRHEIPFGRPHPVAQRVLMKCIGLRPERWRSSSEAESGLGGAVPRGPAQHGAQWSLGRTSDSSFSSMDRAIGVFVWERKTIRSVREKRMGGQEGWENIF
jgi:hypothetical protein